MTDNAHSEGSGDGAKRPDDPDRCPVCGNDYLLTTTPQLNATTLHHTDTATCITVDEGGQLWLFHHSDEDEPDSSPADDTFDDFDTVTTVPLFSDAHPNEEDPED